MALHCLNTSVKSGISVAVRTADVATSSSWRSTVSHGGLHSSQLISRTTVQCTGIMLRNHRWSCLPRAVSASESGELGLRGTAEVQAVLFDMDGVLCNSEEVSREAACEVMKQLYDLDVQPEEFAPFTGTGEANFLGGVARKYGADFNEDAAKQAFFDIYVEEYGRPEANIGFPGARDLVRACREAGLKTALASSADLVKVLANLKGAGIELELFDAVVSADLFERLKPAPDIFLAAAAQVGVKPRNCVVIEDAVYGIQAARAAGMRVIGVTTSLPEADVANEKPDAIRPDISKISLQDILTLRPLPADTILPAAPLQPQVAAS